MYHIFFIHSSVNGHLSCFHDLAIVNYTWISITDFNWNAGLKLINVVVLGLFSSALLVLLQDSLLATASSPKFSELVMKVKLK